MTQLSCCVVHTKAYIEAKIKYKKPLRRKYRKSRRVVPSKGTYSTQSTISVTVINISFGRISGPLGTSKPSSVTTQRLVARYRTHRREPPRGARGAKDGKGEQEDHYLGATIECATQDVVVLAIPARVVPAQPNLRDDSYDYVRRDDGVYAGGLRVER